MLRLKNLNKKERDEIALKEVLDYNFDESIEEEKEVLEIQIKLPETLVEFLKKKGELILNRAKNNPYICLHK